MWRSCTSLSIDAFRRRERNPTKNIAKPCIGLQSCAITINKRTYEFLHITIHIDARAGNRFDTASRFCSRFTSFHAVFMSFIELCSLLAVFPRYTYHLVVVCVLLNLVWMKKRFVPMHKTKNSAAFDCSKVQKRDEKKNIAWKLANIITKSIKLILFSWMKKTTEKKTESSKRNNKKN